MGPKKTPQGTGSGLPSSSIGNVSGIDRKHVADVPCISCRLRRKKCDRRLPICGRCERLHIPVEHCLYKGSVGLHDKDSSVTLEREREKNHELKREFELYKVLRDSIMHSQRKQSSSESQSLFFAGITPHEKSEDHVHFPGVEGYLGSISLASTVFSPKTASPVINAMLSILFDARKVYMSRHSTKNPPLTALKLFEERCLASICNAPNHDGDDLVRNLLQEITAALPTRNDYEGYVEILKQEPSGNRAMMGMPRYSSTVQRKTLEVITFDSNDQPHINIDLDKEPEKLVYLALALILCMLGYYVKARTGYPSNQHEGLESMANRSQTYFCYCKALLNLNLVGNKIVYKNVNENMHLMLAMFQAHLTGKYTASNMYKVTQDNPQETALNTRAIITRAKFFHLHEDLEKWYPDMPKEDVKMYKDVWYSIILMDVLDNLELGYVSSILSEDFRLSGPPDTTSRQALRTIHQVLNGVNFLDGELTAQDSLDHVMGSIKKLKSVYKTLGGTVIGDYDFMSKLSDEALKKEPLYLEEFYVLAERQFSRLIIYNLLHGLYVMCYKYLNAMGHTEETSSDLDLYILLATKYALLCIENTKKFLEMAYLIGSQEHNTVGHNHIMILLSFISCIETTSVRVVLWLGNRMANFPEYSNNTNMLQYLLQSRDDYNFDSKILKFLRTKEYFLGTPKMSEWFENLAIDEDVEALKKSPLWRLHESKIIITCNLESFLLMRRYIRCKHMNLGFLNLTKTFTIGVRYVSVGCRLLLKDEIAEYFRTVHNSDIPLQYQLDGVSTRDHKESHQMDKSPPLAENFSPSGDSGVEFAGLFQDLFENTFGRNSGNDINISRFFGDSDI